MTPRFKRLTAAIFGALFALHPGAVVAFGGANPLVGTWRLNVAKSKFRVSPPPKSAIAKVVSKDGEITIDLSIVNGDGTNSEVRYTANYDGKDYAIAGSRLFNTVALKRLDDHTDEVIYKAKGKVIRSSKRAVSDDGKVLTITDENASRGGTSPVSVWDRQ